MRYTSQELARFYSYNNIDAYIYDMMYVCINE